MSVLCIIGFGDGVLKKMGSLDCVHFIVERIDSVSRRATGKWGPFDIDGDQGKQVLGYKDIVNENKLIFIQQIPKSIIDLFLEAGIRSLDKNNE